MGDKSAIATDLQCVCFPAFCDDQGKFCVWYVCVCMYSGIVIVTAETGKANSIFRKIFSKMKMWRNTETIIVLKMKLDFSRK